MNPGKHRGYLWIKKTILLFLTTNIHLVSTFHLIIKMINTSHLDRVLYLLVHLLTDHLLPQVQEDQKRGRSVLGIHRSGKKCIKKDKKTQGRSIFRYQEKKVDAKVMKPPCNCRLQCRTTFSDEMRKEIFESYWNLASLQRQRDFL